MIKKSRLTKIFAVLIAFCVVFSCFSVGCSDDKKINVDQSRAMGIGEVFLIDNASYDDILARIELMKRVNCKSTRFWFRIGSNGSNPSHEILFKLKDNELVLIDAYYQRVRFALDKLKEAGVTHITLNPCWVYGKKANGKIKYYGTNCPEIGSEDYLPFMEFVEWQYKKVAELFPDIEYIELGNEMNGGFLSINGTEYCSNEDKATVVLDYSYYATKGIKSANPKVQTVLNGLAEQTFFLAWEYNGEKHYNCNAGSSLFMADFLELLYNGIESKNFPTPIENKSTKVDDYFNILAWHPYSSSSLEEWVENNDEIYDVVRNHNDTGRRVFITEYGQVKSTRETGELYVEIIKNINLTPYIEVVHFFILTDTSWCNDTTGDRDSETFVLCYKVKDCEYETSEAYDALVEAFGDR